MAIYASKSLGGFIDTAIGIPGDTLPPDAVEITTAEHTALLVGQASGQLIQFNADAAPTLLTPDPTLTLAQQAGLATFAGLTLTLTGSLTLPATLFPTDTATQSKLAAVVTTINATGEFPGGATSYPMKDASGAWHTLTVGQYKTVAAAIASYVAALDLIIDGNPLGATELPVGSATLTLA